MKKHPRGRVKIAYKFPGFEEAAELFNQCENEHLFTPMLDCSRCPVSEECNRFYNDYVACESEEGKGEYLRAVKKRLKELKEEKHKKSIKPSSHPSMC